jgi:hypothetical protein
MINNIDLIIPLLHFDSEDDFYHLQVLKRKNENPDLGSNSYVVKTYYIRSIEYLHKKMPEIICLCEFHNARAYINLNPRSFEKLSFHLMKKVSDIIMNRDYKSCRKAYESVSGTYGTGKDKKWVIDIDYRDFPGHETSNVFQEIQLMLWDLHSEAGNDPHVVKIPTKNGFHFIVSPFNVQRFSKEYPKIDIHKNNPTILYV